MNTDDGMYVSNGIITIDPITVGTVASYRDLNFCQFMVCNFFETTEYTKFLHRDHGGILLDVCIPFSVYLWFISVSIKFWTTKWLIRQSRTQHNDPDSYRDDSSNVALYIIIQCFKELIKQKKLLQSKSSHRGTVDFPVLFPSLNTP